MFMYTCICRIHRLQRGKTPATSVLGMTLKNLVVGLM